MFLKYRARDIFAPETSTPEIGFRLMAEEDVFVVGFYRSPNSIVVGHKPDPELGYKFADAQRAQPIHVAFPPRLAKAGLLQNI